MNQTKLKKSAQQVPIAQRPIIREPKILVFKEKHGNRYFNIPDDKALFRVALKVLTGRFEQGYWYYRPGNEDKPMAPDFTKEQVASLPESMRPAAEKKLREYTDAMRRYDASVEDYDDIKKAVETKDGRLAWQALTDHQDGEYEGFRLEHVESADDV